MVVTWIGTDGDTGSGSTNRKSTAQDYLRLDQIATDAGQQKTMREFIKKPAKRAACQTGREEQSTCPHGKALHATGTPKKVAITASTST